MNLARSDTYINVYLPRTDGEDPRRFMPSNSPIFEEEKVYKFSDQITKDRPLFLGKKSVSLYEIYYKKKEKPSLETVTETRVRKYAHDDAVVQKVADDISEDYSREINTVSLSLNSEVKQTTTQSHRRFNEPLNSYVSNKKRAQMITRYDHGGDIERQVSSYDLTPRKREMTFFEKRIQSRPLRNPHKIHSAVETRVSTELFGLPPIIAGGNRAHSSVFPMHSDALQNRTVVQAMPIRLSSKPHAIWRQSTEALLERHAPRSRVTQMKQVSSFPAIRQVAQ